MTTRAGRPVFRHSRLAAMLTALLVPLTARSETIDVDIRTGIEDPRPPAEEQVSVGRGLRSAWKRVVLTCSSDGARLLRERRDFPEGTTRLQFTALPNDVDCEVRLRGGEPTATVHIETEASDPTPR